MPRQVEGDHAKVLGDVGIAELMPIFATVRPSRVEADKRNAIQKMQQDIANLKPDSPQFQRSLAALDLEMANFEAWEKMIRILPVLLINLLLSYQL